MHDRRTLRTIEATAVLLFLLQALQVLLSSLFGLIYDAVFAETIGAAELAGVVAAVLAVCLAPLFAPRQEGRSTLLLSAMTAALARVVLTVNQPGIRLWSSLLVIAGAVRYGTALLDRCPRAFADGLAWAFVFSQVLRAVGHTYDVSLRAWWLPLQALISLVLCAVAHQLYSTARPDSEAPGEDGVTVPIGLALGALLFLEISMLGLPNAVARWTGVDYALAAPALMSATLLAILSPMHWGGFALITLTLLVGRITDHTYEELGALAAMLLAQLAFLSRIRVFERPSRSRRPRLSFALAIMSFLVLNVALAFAFTYPYTIPCFRDKGIYVFLLAAVVCLPLVLRSGNSVPEPPSRAGALGWGAAASIVVATTLFAVPPRAEVRQREDDSFRVATYNIHYGYDSKWRFSLEEQARTVEESGADIIMLQEVDAGRITSYSVDDALWLAHRLGMRQVFGGALEELSGVALLTRFPVVSSDKEYLTSELEQTAIVHARMLLNTHASDGEPAIEAAHTLDAYGTWLGLEPQERARQLDVALNVIDDAHPVVLGGDFNAMPGSPTYQRLQAAGFEDPFVTTGLDGPPTSPAVDPAERIDFVWSRGLKIQTAQVLDSLASDHRMVVVEFALP